MALLNISPTHDSVLKVLNYILAFNSGTAKSFSPLDKFGLGEAFLLTRKWKSEAEGQDLILNSAAVYKIRQTFGYVIKQSLSRT